MSSGPIKYMLSNRFYLLSAQNENFLQNFLIKILQTNRNIPNFTQHKKCELKLKSLCSIIFSYLKYTLSYKKNLNFTFMNKYVNICIFSISSVKFKNYVIAI